MSRRQGTIYVPWTNTEDDFLRENYTLMHTAEIGVMLGRTAEAVRLRANKHLNLSKPYGKFGTSWSEAEEAFLCENIGKMTAKDIAHHLGRSQAAINTRAITLSLDSARKQRRAFIRHDYFEAINNPVKAYILGWLASDGCVASDRTEVKISLHVKDIEAVRLIRDELAPNYKVRLHRQGQAATFAVNSARMKQDLIRLGVTPCKSLTIQYPSIPSEFDNSFILGCFDGDGCLSYYSNGRNKEKKYPRWQLISASEQFLLDIQNRIFQATGVITSGPRPSNRSKALTLYTQSAKAKLVDAWLHADVPGLARKRLSQG